MDHPPPQLDAGRTAADGRQTQPAADRLPARRSQAVWWLIGVSLAVIAMTQLLRVGQPETVLAQPVAQAGARGVFAFTGQLTKGTYGVFMVDVDAGTLWCYEYISPKRELRLVAGRLWIYDRYLEAFNTGQPSVEEIEQLVELQRAKKLQSMGGAPP
ncbi:MAG: hypothetical protein GY778_12855 [bacterium]|nr:hypothetical protein [bacterium]